MGEDTFGAQLQAAGAIVSFDPSLRLLLWDSLAEAAGIYTENHLVRSLSVSYMKSGLWNISPDPRL